MSITVPVAGDRIVYGWGASVAEQLNREILLMKTADQSSNSTTLADITDLTFPVVNGKQYTGTLRLSYAVSATNQGCQIGITCPTGTVLVQVTTYGAGPDETHMRASGDVTTVATATGTTPLGVEIKIMRYDCTADGTFAIRFRRGGTSGSTGVTIHKGSGGTILVSA